MTIEFHGISEIEEERIKSRFDSFWNRAETDRACLAVMVPDPAGIEAPAPKPPDKLEDRWLNARYRVRKAAYELGCYRYRGEAFPYFFPNQGPGSLAAYLGGHAEYSESTVWFDHAPLLSLGFQHESFTLHEDCRFWRSLVECIDLAGRTGMWTGTTDLGGSLDIAASLRGAENLLYDLMDSPEEVDGLVKEIDVLWIEALQRLHALENPDGSKGYGSWLPLWCRHSWYPLQCDFSVMISPDQFERFVVPSLARQASALEYAVYHLDGPGEIQHLDRILEIPEIDVIEWVPLPDSRGWLPQADSRWLPMFDRIQSSGKGLILRSVAPDDIQRILERLSPKGLFLSTLVSSEEEADDLLQEAVKWTRR